MTAGSWLVVLAVVACFLFALELVEFIGEMP